MLANFHTHSTFCDGKNTPEEIVVSAIEKGFSAIGFSSHGYTDFDLRYCMKDLRGYISEINRLKGKYGNKIEVYLGVEEDAFSPLNRNDFDYIIGSSHYFNIGKKYYPIDSSPEYFKKCLEVFNYDLLSLAETYYKAFLKYLTVRKPDIIGHFDLVTKYDELGLTQYLANAEYNKIAENYVAAAIKTGCIFELNTGAIGRNLRTTPYPSENLLYVLKKADARLILASDSHNIDTLAFGFEDAKKYLKNIGFTRLTTLKNGDFVEYDI